MALRDRPNNISDEEEDDDDEDEDEDEVVEDSRNEPLTQTPPQTPNNSRIKNAHSDKHDVTPGRIVNANRNMTKDEAIEILAVNRDFSIREVKMKCMTLAIKNHTDERNEMCCFTKEDGMEMLKGVANVFDFNK